MFLFFPTVLLSHGVPWEECSLVCLVAIVNSTSVLVNIELEF